MDARFAALPNIPQATTGRGVLFSFSSVHRTEHVQLCVQSWHLPEWITQHEQELRHHPVHANQERKIWGHHICLRLQYKLINLDKDKVKTTDCGICFPFIKLECWMQYWEIIVTRQDQTRDSGGASLTRRPKILNVEKAGTGESLWCCVAGGEASIVLH